MREIGPIERALVMLEKHEREIALLKAELAAHLPNDDGGGRKDYFHDPLTGKRRYFRTKSRGGQK
jgi:hypothetical protein